MMKHKNECLYVCVCVCACMRACKREREKEREREMILPNNNYSINKLCLVLMRDL